MGWLEDPQDARAHLTATTRRPWRPNNLRTRTWSSIQLNSVTRRRNGWTRSASVSELSGLCRTQAFWALPHPGNDLLRATNLVIKRVIIDHRPPRPPSPPLSHFCSNLVPHRWDCRHRVRSRQGRGRGQGQGQGRARLQQGHFEHAVFSKGTIDEASGD